MSAMSSARVSGSWIRRRLADAGDGGAVARIARARPRVLVVGIDADAAAMRQRSAAAARRPRLILGAPPRHPGPSSRMASGAASAALIRLGHGAPPVNSPQDVALFGRELLT
jgi:hypothetical protein